MKQWDQFVYTHPHGTPFHTSGWLKTIGNTYKYKPNLYVRQDDNNRLEGVFPCFHINSFITGKRLVSIPFSDYGGPLYNCPEKRNQDLVHIMGKMRKNCRCLEIRSNICNQDRFTFHNHYKYHVVELDSNPDVVLKNTNRLTKRCIRKAKKFGVEVQTCNTIWGINEFYRLNILTRKKHGMPPQPFGFFENLYKNMIATKDAFLLLAKYENKVIAAGLFIKFKETLYFKYTASDPELLAKVSPNHLMTWKAIEEASRNGFKYLDFGRTSTSNSGLTRYKEMWGAKPLDLPYYYYPNTNSFKPDTESALSYRLFTRFCRHLPDEWLTFFGAKIYRHIG